MDKIIRVIRRNIHKVLFFNKYFGKKIKVYGVPKYINAKNVIFGKNIKINDNVFFHASNKIIIEDNVTLSYGATLLTESYVFDDIESFIKKQHKSEQIYIGKNSWIGANATILPGVRIGKNVIVGAGSVVTHDLTDEFTIYAGNPAKKIRKFGDNNENITYNCNSHESTRGYTNSTKKSN